MVKENYTCIRCSYNTKLKPNMYRHFYFNKKCPATNKDIDLTDDVKQYILNNRIYKNYKPNKNPIIKTIKTSDIKLDVSTDYKNKESNISVDNNISLQGSFVDIIIKKNDNQ